MDGQQLETMRGVRDLEAVMAIDGLLEELRWSIVDRAATRDPESYHSERMETAWKRLFGAVRSGAWRVLYAAGWAPGYEEVDIENGAAVERMREEVAKALAGLEAGEVVAVWALMRGFAEERGMEEAGGWMLEVGASGVPIG